MLPSPNRWTPYAGLRPVVCLALALLPLIGGCGGDDKTDPPPPPTQLALVTQPSTQAQSRVSLAPQPVVQLQDAQGGAVAQANVPVTVSIATGGGSLTGTTTVNTSSSGRATFSELAIGGTVGPRTLTFTSPDLAPVTSGSIDLSSGAAATIAENGGGGQTSATGNPVAIAPSVVVRDADNNPVAGVAVTFQVTAGGGTVDPPTPVPTNSNGVAALTSWTLGVTPGPNSLQATAAGLSGPSVVFTATGVGGAGTIAGTITLSSSLLSRMKTGLRTSARAFPPLARSKSGSFRDAFQSFRARRSKPSQSHAGRPEYVPDELIVTFRTGTLGVSRRGAAALTSPANAMAAAQAIRSHLTPHLSAQQLAVAGVSPAIGAARLRLEDPSRAQQVMAALRMDPAISGVERNGIIRLQRAEIVPNDPFYGRLAWHYAAVDLPEAWTITTGTTNTLVAVIDDGIRFDHPDIAANLTSDGYDFASNVPLSVCGGGSIGASGDSDNYDPDPTIPAAYDYDAARDCVSPSTFAAHGLHVAGTIGAVGNNGVGVTGINWTVRIRPVRVLGIGGGGSHYDIAQGILYAAGLPADNGAGGTVQAPSQAKIISMSLGSSDGSAVLEDAVIAASNAGSLIVAAAGNDASSTSHFPAAYPAVLSVSAVGPDRLLASYSSSGPAVDIAAPGGDIVDGDDTFLVGSTIWNFDTNLPAYGATQGTSMAVPHVSGIAALLLANDPGLTAADLRSRLTTFAVDAGAAGHDNLYGAGIVNARNSLTQSLGPTRQLHARLYDGATGSMLRTVPVTGDSYSFAGLIDGVYLVFAGQDEDGDQQVGVPGRRWGAFGGSSTPTSISIDGPDTRAASFSIGFPSEEEPNETEAQADYLPVGGYLRGALATTADVDLSRVLIPQTGSYTFETSAVDGACGFALEEDTVLGLYTATGTLVASNDDIDPAALNLCSRITTTLTAGTYYVSVEGFFAGRYRVQVRPTP